MQVQLKGFEAQIHAILSAKHGEFVNRREIETSLYGEVDKIPISNCLEVFIYRLRKKGIPVDTKRNLGYRLVKKVTDNDQ